MSKYHSKPVVVDNIRFDSLSEAHRYAELKLAERSGEIVSLRVHPKFPIVVNGMKVCAYVGDFAYIRDGVEVLEDVKSSVTLRLPVYRLKKKLMKACHGIDIVEVMKS